MGTRARQPTQGWVRVFAAACTVVAAAACTPAPRLVDTPVTSPSQDKPVDTGEVVVGVTDMAGGFNPHEIADQSPLTTALANLVLPSVFRTGPDGTPQLDPTLMVSADVTKADPYTVTYRIRADASWSDAAPIAAEDFVYLWDRMIAEPGTIDAAGYRLISDIAAQDGGKSVEVTFSQPYPGWRTLFSGLLPAHLVKDAPGGWPAALQNSFPAAGGPYAVKTLDRDRGEIVLERNDRYWEQPATLDRLIMRLGEQDGLVDALDAGHDQLAVAPTDSVGQNLLTGLGDTVSVQTVPRPAVTSVLLRPGSAKLAEQPVRQAIMALLDRAQLITVGTGNGPAAGLRADAQVLAPSMPGYAASGPPGGAEPTELLDQAGYTKTDGAWTANGEPVRLVIGAAAERPVDERLAQEVARQLTAAGFTTEVVTPTGAELFAGLFTPAPDGTSGSDDSGDGDGQQAVDIAIAAQPVGGDPATTLATNFGCAKDEQGRTGTAGANPMGFCDTGLQPTIDAALNGSLPLAEALPTIEPALWRSAVVLPLYQQADSLAVRPEMTGVTIGPPLSGPFAGAPFWRRAAG